MNGFSAHQHEKFIDECEERNIKVIFLAPHSSDQTQMLDLGIFGVQKQLMLNIRIPHDNLNWQTMQVIKIYDSYSLVVFS